MKKPVKYIKLTQGKIATIDAEDFELVNKYKWYYRKSGRTNGKNGYAQTYIYDSALYLEAKKRGNWKYGHSLFMHNLILLPKEGFIIDHINREGLDNRKKNLRLVTIRQNHANFPPRKNQTGFRGVHFHQRLINTKPFEASIRCDNKQYSLGTFKTAKEAAAAYNIRAKEYFGECAQLNTL